MGDLIVTIKEGQLKGKIVQNICGGNYYSFQGIPYAKSPLGPLRFKAPQPPESWIGVRDASKEGNECYSRHSILKHIVGSEDCLFLNVYTPELPKKNTPLKPVMFWVHGGGFTNGSGNVEFYGPDFLLSEEVVIVTINYRLGFFGFLSFQEPSIEIPGNAGLKDQIMALRWVQNNISQFCGDPNNVTIFGESAGGAAVHYLMLSPMGKGLFHKAILQSGCATVPWAEGQHSAALIAKALNLETTEEKEIFNIIKDMPTEELFKIQEKVPDPFSVDLKRPYGAIVEKGHKEMAFLPSEPMNLISSGEYNQVPFMIGFTSREGMLFEIMTKFRFGEIKFVRDFEHSVPFSLNLPKGSELSKTIAKKIKSFYYGDEEPSHDNIDQYYMMQTDVFFLHPTFVSLKLHLSVSNVPIYFYRVSIQSKLNLYKKIAGITNSGVCHADDIGYIFKTQLTPEVSLETLEGIAVRRFVKLWTNFAKNGNPNLEELDSLINVTWKPVSKGQLHFIDIGENLTVGVNPEQYRLNFWEDIFKVNNSTSKL